MKKILTLALLTIFIAGTTASFAQQDKATKKEVKMDKKDSKGKVKKGVKKNAKMDKKAAKAK